MKILTKLLMVHWHYFNNEVIEFGELNFLTGKNASGKSTIIDALQLILYGDTSGSYFNKSANNRGTRTLRGYLLCELGDDDKSGFRTLRGGTRFTSYLAMEFYDDERDRRFTAGCCFDVYSENDIPRLYFLYDGALHPSNFIVDGTPLDIAALRAYLREQYNGHFETTDVGRDFRTKLYGKLGGLRDRFTGLLKKAVSFDPNVNIQDFISDFVCDDQQTVDVSHMQDNIRSYKRLEHESAVVGERIAALEKINATFANFIEASNGELLYTFLLDRAAADIQTAKISNAVSEAEKVAGQLEVLLKVISDSDRKLTELRGQRDTLNAELLSDGTAQTLEQIDRGILEKEAKILSLVSEYERAVGVLQKRINTWAAGVRAMLQKLDVPPPGLSNAGIMSRIGDMLAEGRGFTLPVMDADAVKQLGETGLAGLSGGMDALRTHAIQLYSRIGEEQEQMLKRRAELTVERESLESGIYKFPQEVLDLKDAVASRLRTLAKADVNVRIVAEAAEIAGDRWRNAIEGYLNTQKFYVIVPDEYIKDAMRVLDTIKREKRVYRTGVVDIEKLRRIDPVADKGSLAEEIETEDPEVRLFLNYTLGRLMKCDRVGDLRRHRTSVTDEGVLYQNFVVRAMDPDRWKMPAIGQGAIQRRLDAVLKEIDGLTGQIACCSSLKTGLDAVSGLEMLSGTEIGQSVTSVKGVEAVPALREDLASLRKNRDAIDTTAIDILKMRIAALDNDIGALDNKLRGDGEQKGSLLEKQRHLTVDLLPELKDALLALENKISDSYEKEWLESTGAPRYNRELASRGDAAQIAAAFPREQSRARNARDFAWESLVDLRRNYNNVYKMGYSVGMSDNAVYNDACAELSEIKLPEYETRIGDAKAKALEQFQENFISRIQNNISMANRQIEDLNRAIKGAAFGEDIYRFRIIPKPEYKRYHDMIMDEMITQGGYNLLSIQFNDKYKEEIADLFAIITNEDGGGSEYERRVSEFTDFRTYLNFDLEVVGRDGFAQRLSKTMSKQSGGETQTPFYIAVLASFAQLYRAGRDNVYRTSRLIIFDEAFSKMDGERIVNSIGLLRKFRFQVVLSAPPEKVDDIANLVDKNICVYREGHKVSVGYFEPKTYREHPAGTEGAGDS